MTSPRFVQNFRGGRAFLVGLTEGHGLTLATTLGKLGLQVERGPCDAAALEALAAAIHPDSDVIFVDGDTDVPGVPPLGGADRLPLAPIIALLGVETPGRLRALMTLGATAFMRKPVQAASVYSTLYLGVNQHRMRRRLDEVIAGHEERRRGRPSLIKAILALTRQGRTDEAAYEFLRRDAMRERLSVEAYSDIYLARLQAAQSTSSPTALAVEEEEAPTTQGSIS
jgi:two-component system, response regulator PdtaR